MWCFFSLKVQTNGWWLGLLYITFSSFCCGVQATSSQEMSMDKADPQTKVLRLYQCMPSKKVFPYIVQEGEDLWHKYGPKLHPFLQECPSLLLEVAEKKHFNMLARLLSLSVGDSIHYRGKDGNTLLSLLLAQEQDQYEKERKEIVLQLLQHKEIGKIINQGEWSEAYLKEKKGIEHCTFPLLLAVLYGRWDVLTAMLDIAALDMNQRESFEGSTALHSLLHQTCVLKQCIEKKREVIDFAFSSKQQPCLLYLAYKNHAPKETIALLLKQYSHYGKDIGFRQINDHQASIWSWLIMRGSVEQLEQVIYLPQPIGFKKPPQLDFTMELPKGHHALTYLATRKKEEESSKKRSLICRLAPELINQYNKKGTAPLYTALEADAATAFFHLLQQKADPNVSYQGKKLLWWVYQKKKWNYLIPLLKAGASDRNIDGKGHDFFLICQERRPFELLMTYCPTPEATDDQHSTLLKKAVIYSNTLLLQMILEDKKQEHLDPKALSLEATVENITWAKQLFSCALLRKKAAQQHMHMLHLMCTSNTLDLVLLKWILKQGYYDPNEVDLHGNTPLAVAIQKNNVKVGRILLDDPQTDPNQPIHQWYTPIYLAFLDERLDFLRLLLKKKADPDRYAEKTGALIALCIEKGCFAMAQALLEGGADPDGTTLDGNTALTIACQKASNAKIVKVLLDHHADPNKGNREEKTPLMLAVFHKNTTILSLLLQAGADASFRNKECYTALFWAIEFVRPEAVRLLLGQNPPLVITIEKPISPYCPSFMTKKLVNNLLLKGFEAFALPSTSSEQPSLHQHKKHKKSKKRMLSSNHALPMDPARKAKRQILGHLIQHALQMPTETLKEQRDHPLIDLASRGDQHVSRVEYLFNHYKGLNLKENNIGFWMVREAFIFRQTKAIRSMLAHQSLNPKGESLEKFYARAFIHEWKVSEWRKYNCIRFFICAVVIGVLIYLFYRGQMFPFA